MGILFPTETAMPNSSLAHYLALAVRDFGTADSRYFVSTQGMDSARTGAGPARTRSAAAGPMRCWAPPTASCT